MPRCGKLLDSRAMAHFPWIVSPTTTVHYWRWYSDMCRQQTLLESQWVKWGGREREGKSWRRGKELEEGEREEGAGRFNRKVERGEKCRGEGEEAWNPACPLFVEPLVCSECWMSCSHIMIHMMLHDLPIPAGFSVVWLQWNTRKEQNTDLPIQISW